MLRLCALLALAPLALHAQECQIDEGALRHEWLDALYRDPLSPLTPGQRVRLRLRSGQGDLNAARAHVYDPLSGETRRLNMHWDGDADQSDDYDLWAADLEAPDPTRLRYAFEAIDEDAEAECEARVYFGHRGVADTLQEALDQEAYISVYDPSFEVPEWLRGAVIYQVFPDRFRDGDPSNNRPSGSFHYGHDSLYRSGAEDWNTAICDPQEDGPCKYKWSSNFYGGDLDGLADKVEAGYFDSLGVTVLYLNPIFASPSNHRYDASDYHLVDQDLGGLEAFQRLKAVAEARGMRILLDGVFNHVSSDSIYFDRYARFEEEGACEAESSPFRGWFYFPDIGSPAGGGSDRCAGDVTYEAWWGYGSMPKLRAGDAEVREFLLEGPDSVASRWLVEGASGWRLDVGADVDQGFDDNDFWETMRAAIRRDGRPDAALIGEEWGDPTPWLLGREWDSAMHYQLRSLLLNFVFTRCSGPGCLNGRHFEGGDSNYGSPLGPIEAISPSAVDWHLRAWASRLPQPALYGMMNLAGSHDTSRLSFLLGKISGDDPARARRALEVVWSALYALPGAPTVYYGDEVGLVSDSVHHGSWDDDPYNRAPFPWPDTPGDLEADTSVLDLHRRLVSLRHAYPALARGAFIPSVVVDDEAGAYAFARREGGGGALIAFNRGEGDYELNVEAAAARAGLPNAPLVEAFGRDGALPPMSARIYVDPAQADTPRAPGARGAYRADGLVEIEPVLMDTAGGREAILRYTLEAEGGEPIIVTPPRFGGPITAALPAARFRLRASSLLADSGWGPWIEPASLQDLGAFEPPIEPTEPPTEDAGIDPIEPDAGTPPPQDVGVTPPPDNPGGSPIEPDAGLEPAADEDPGGCAQGLGRGPILWAWILGLLAMLHARRRG